MSDKPYVHCIFAEDIRQEAGGQSSVIGTFQTYIRLPAFPWVLPKIAIHADLVVPIGYPPRDVQLWLKLGKETIQSIPIPIETIQQSKKETESFEEAESFCLRIALVAAPLAVTAPGQMRIEIRYGDEILISNALSIGVLKQ